MNDILKLIKNNCVKVDFGCVRTSKSLSLLIKIYVAILAKRLKLQRFDNINCLPSVKD